MRTDHSGAGRLPWEKGTNKFHRLQLSPPAMNSSYTKCAYKATFSRELDTDSPGQDPGVRKPQT